MPNTDIPVMKCVRFLEWKRGGGGGAGAILLKDMMHVVSKLYSHAVYFNSE